MSESSTLLDQILAGLMGRYKARVPDVDKILTSMVSTGMVSGADDVENDHIAFRTMGVEHLGIASLEKIFLHCGYQKREAFNFEKKKLNAYWYSPPSAKYPRIFISELRVKDLSPQAQEIVRKYTSEVKADPVEGLNLDEAETVDDFLHSSLWRTPTWEDYSTLLDESEYAGWTVYNRYYLNHFTISVHNLPEPYGSLDKFNDWLESLGVKLNDSGGKIKKSPDGKLLQSSTVAHKVEALFPHEDGSERSHLIAGSYVEFAERRVLDEFAGLPADEIKREHRRDGFEAGNADKIFESTFREQTDKS